MKSIGLKKTPNSNIDWSLYRKEVLGQNDPIGIIEYIYIDKKTDHSQVRRELWSKEDKYTWYLVNVHGVKDSIREGESISLRW